MSLLSGMSHAVQIDHNHILS